ncbi:MAG: glycosyltransferase family 39 protein [Candidatus Sumerlaeia bacterium]|nr:glycosyltransferase family 39 protein [Candidatus Sumerlaeia bacterium]
MRRFSSSARLAALLGLAAALRLIRLDLMAFEMDEGAACLFVVRFVHAGLPPLLGIKTSFQFYNSPLFLYVISPAFLVTSDPRFAAACFALLGTLAVYIVYRTGVRFFSPAVGWVAGTMMAVSPTAIEYSRRLWGHSLVQILCPVIFYLLLRWAIERKPKTLFWLALLIAAAMQFHFSASLLWVQLLVAWALFRPPVDWAALGCGLALGLLPYFPYALEQADRHFSDLQIITQLIFHGTGEYRPFGFQPLVYWFFSVTDFAHCNFLQAKHGEFLANLGPYRAIRFLAGVAWVAALSALAVNAARGAGRHRNTRDGMDSVNVVDGKDTRQDFWFVLSPLSSRLSLFLLSWALVPLAVFLALRVPVVPPYFLVVYPVPFLAVAWLGVKVAERLKMGGRTRRLSWVPAVLLTAWLACQIFFEVVLLLRLDRAGGGVGSYISFGHQREAMRFVAGHSAGRTVVLSEEQLDPARGIDFRYWYLLWMHDRNTERFFPKDRERAEYWYVLRNLHYPVQPEFDQFLAGYPSKDFGRLRIVVIPRPGPWPALAPPLKDGM